MGTLWRKSGLIERDNNDDRAEGALAYFYTGGTTTPLTVYQDADETTPHEHPVEADGNGRWPAVYVPYVTSYDEKVTTSGGTQLSYYLEISNPEPFDETFEVDEDAQLNTGDCFFNFTDTTRTGAVRANGRTIGNASSGASERANADTEDLFTHLWNNLANDQAAVSSGRGASAAADYAANKTITLPDLRHAIPIGLGDMGNSNAGLIPSTVFHNGDATTPGSLLGSVTHTLTSSEIPSHTHSVSIVTDSQGTHTHSIAITSGGASVSHTHSGTTASDGAHTHTYNYHTPQSQTGAGGGNYNVINTASTPNTSSDGAHTHTFTTGIESADHTHLVSGTSGSGGAHTHTVSGTSGSTGSGSAHNNVQRGILVTWFIKL